MKFPLNTQEQKEERKKVSLSLKEYQTTVNWTVWYEAISLAALCCLFRFPSARRQDCLTLIVAYCKVYVWFQQYLEI